MRRSSSNSERGARRGAGRTHAAPFVLSLALFVVGCSSDRPSRVDLRSADVPAPRNVFTSDELRAILRLSPLPAATVDPTNRFSCDPRAARLGHSLFFDEALSRSGDTSCATCHDASKGLADGLARPEGSGPTSRHTMTLWNAAYQRWFFWDGRRDSLWAQALTPLEAPAEHDFTRLEVAHRIARDAPLARAYGAVFGELPELDDRTRFPEAASPLGDPESPAVLAWHSMSETDRDSVNRVFANVGKAIAAHVARLVSSESPFDRYVEELRAGKIPRIGEFGPTQEAGLRIFVGKGQCTLCHSGPVFSDFEFHDTLLPSAGTDAGRYAGGIAVRADPFNGYGSFSDDTGAGSNVALEYLALTRANHGEFRTPSLRNVELSAPYMHSGELRSLEEVVAHYSDQGGTRFGRHATQPILNDIRLTSREQAAVVAFLKTLTSTDVRRALLAPPTGSP